MTDVGVEWGLPGALNYAPQVDAIVVVDVLSFSTSMAVAIERDGQVWPHPGGPAAAELARSLDAVLVGPRRSPVGPSLSPASLLDLEIGSRVVLPSPNGGLISAALVDLAVGQVLCAGLRNASAVGRYLVEAPDISSVVIVPAGERWSDGSMRVAYEDQVGAGAIVARMLMLDPALGLSTEAEAAMAVYERPRPLADTASGRELTEMGFEIDVSMAGAIDASNVVPLVRDGRFVAA